MKYHLDIFEGEVELPKYIDIEYESLNDASEILCNFIHSFDGNGKQISGRVCDEEGEDVDYSSSIPKYTYVVEDKIEGLPVCARSVTKFFDDLDEAEKLKEEWIEDFYKNWVKLFGEEHVELTSYVGEEKTERKVIAHTIDGDWIYTVTLMRD